ncbi:MAG TPA: SpoIVB peptidase [Clostridia bacterium]|nr:SpoIVB peptidase [Clostridia bacterium]
MRKQIKIIAAVCGIVMLSLLTAGLLLADRIPDRFSVIEGQELTFENRYPIVAVSANQPQSMEVSGTLKAGEQYKTDLKLFGVVEVKNVSVKVVKEARVVPCGYAFGVKLHTEGVVVVGLSDVDTKDGSENPSYAAGIRMGDIILAINGKTVNSNKEVSEIFNQSDGKPMKITLRRGNVGFEVKMTPVKSVSQNQYKTGMWVRDSTAGIGTITFTVPSTGLFAGLGHGICDVDTGEILPLMTADIVKVDISGIARGNKGQPGELEGKLHDETWGSLYSNTQTGVFGILNNSSASKAIPVAMRQQVHEGPAKILATLDKSGPKEYSISIEKVHFNDAAPTKNMIVRITDSSLIAKAGGIVQGMSGCPIIQDGKLVGAITHVFVNDPLRGYGIFAENMIDTAGQINNSFLKQAS